VCIITEDAVKKNCMGAALGSQYGAMTVAAEILIAQLHSQSKLTTAWHKNRKILYENELLKAREPAPDVQKWRLSLKIKDLYAWATVTC
jgi:hypothetical protein